MPGNNEGLTFTKEELARLYGEEANFPVLCCNLLDRETGTYPDWLQPGIIITKGGLRIGLVGATAPYPPSIACWDGMSWIP